MHILDGVFMIVLSSLVWMSMSADMEFLFVLLLLVATWWEMLPSVVAYMKIPGCMYGNVGCTADNVRNINDGKRVSW